MGDCVGTEAIQADDGEALIVYGDGSGGPHSADPRRRRCGRAVCTLVPDGEGGWRVDGGIGRGLTGRQTVPRAELQAADFPDPAAEEPAFQAAWAVVVALEDGDVQLFLYKAFCGGVGTRLPQPFPSLVPCLLRPPPVPPGVLRPLGPLGFLFGSLASRSASSLASSAF